MLRGVRWYLVIPTFRDNPIGHILKDQVIFLDCVTFEDKTDKLFRNVGNQPPTYAA
jgi:hypothetical protein